MIKDNLTALEFEILELFRDGRIYFDDTTYKMTYSDKEKSIALSSLLDNDYLKAYLQIDNHYVFYIEMTKKRLEFYKEEKKIMSKEKLNKIEFQYLLTIDWRSNNPLDDYIHHFPDEIASYEMLKRLEKREFIKKECRGESNKSNLYYILTAKAKDYLWLLSNVYKYNVYSG